ncbi:hypothetical protein F5X97DRAFT_45326 [Nemania serpens]|nr:hypothetical protein F5X97DRAFT_45326 [Nemania serpens]
MGLTIAGTARTAEFRRTVVACQTVSTPLAAASPAIGDNDRDTNYMLTDTLNNIEVTEGTAAAHVFSASISGLLGVPDHTGDGDQRVSTIDGPSVAENCGRIFREVLDGFDTSSTRHKQGYGSLGLHCVENRTTC